MNAIYTLSIQPWVERLGWTLVHFLWQGALIAAVYAAARNIYRRTANARYLLACAALACMVAMPIATWIVMRVPDASAHKPAAVPVNRTATIPRNGADVALAVATWPVPLRAVVNGSRYEQLLPWIVAMWLLARRRSGSGWSVVGS